MKFLQGVAGCFLLLLATCTPIGCDYVTKEGPQWMRPSPDPGASPGGTTFSAGVLFIACIVGAFIIFSEAYEDSRDRRK